MIFLAMNINLVMVSDASAACCGLVVGRAFSNASRQNNEEDRNGGFVFAFMLAGLCAWVNSQNENKNK